MNQKAVDLKDIIYRYGSSYILKKINFCADYGEIAVLYGANGSGKTTLLRIIATLLTPNKGSGNILGFSLEKKSEIRKQILLISHNLGFYSELNAKENLLFSASMQIDIQDNEIGPILDRVGLSNVKNRVREFSSGMKKRLALAKILLLKPKLILFDEPFAALDPTGKDLTEEILLEQKDSTVIITSHEPERAKRIADRELYLSDGVLSVIN